ncbi:MAG TPA: YqeG family HAD IIIA-type phosphatase [Trueperaceae bacterium]|nr:YqeG family HAD IIIA-type phosphatase [Trueperaceae bacterium]
MLRPKLRPSLRPDLRVDSLAEVTPALLASLGVSSVFVDLDDTLIASDSDVPAAGSLGWLASLSAGGLAVVILSNGRHDRVARLAEQAGVPGLALAGKPFARAFRRARRLLGEVDPAAIAMVGDQLFTDVIGAKRAGMVTILVRPLTKGKLPHTRIARRLERMLLEDS